MSHARSTTLVCLATILFALAICPGDAQTRSADARFVQASEQPGAVQAALASAPMCTEDLKGLSITVQNAKDLAGFEVNYTAAGTPAGVVGFSWSQSGPFTDTLEVSVLLDGSGSGKSTTFYYKALAGGMAEIQACGPELGCLGNPFVVTVAGIESVSLTAIDSPLDANPNVGGGLRMYPDHQFPFDSTNRRTVRVRAVTQDALSGIELQFKSFDMDDPSSDARPIDATGIDGDDNYGTPSAGSLGAFTATTDATGVAEVTFEVTMQPGDNFKVAATCKAGYLNSVRAVGIDLQDSGGHSLSTGRAAATELLTVWRKAHIEMDSMGAVSGNLTIGVVASAAHSRRSPTTKLVLYINDLEQHRFKGGEIRFEGIGTFRVLDNGTNEVEVDGLIPDPAALANKGFVLVDDDDYNGNDADLAKDGDEGEDVMWPDITLLTDSVDDGVCNGSSDNIFGAAYVCPVFDVGDNNDNAAFVLNLPDSAAGRIAAYDFDAMATERELNFWTLYLWGAYQHDTNMDADSDTEKNGIMGAVDAISGVGASIYLETISDNFSRYPFPYCREHVVVAHELTHLFGGTHPEGGLMQVPCNKRPGAFLSPATIRTIRALDHP